MKQLNEETLERPRMATLGEIPVVDLGLASTEHGLKTAAELVRSACLNSAFFLISNHGLPQETLKAAFAATRKFFELPIADREKWLRNEARRGYVPLGATKHPGKLGALKDSYDIGVDLPASDPDVVAGLPMHGQNIWPDVPGFREPLETYFEEITKIGMQLNRVLAVSLSLPEDTFSREFEKPMTSTRFIHYPRPEDFEEGQFGLGAYPHTDYGFLTILAPDPAGGLEVCLPNGEWIEVPHIEDSLVINLGDLTGRWTNNLYKSNVHRVVNRLGRARFSIPTFFNPSYRTIVECLPTCVDSERPAQYAPILAGNYITQRLQTNQGFRPGQVS